MVRGGFNGWKQKLLGTHSAVDRWMFAFRALTGHVKCVTENGIFSLFCVLNLWFGSVPFGSLWIIFGGTTVDNCRLPTANIYDTPSVP